MRGPPVGDAPGFTRTCLAAGHSARRPPLVPRQMGIPTDTPSNGVFIHSVGHTETRRCHASTAGGRAGCPRLRRIGLSPPRRKGVESGPAPPCTPRTERSAGSDPSTTVAPSPTGRGGPRRAPAHSSPAASSADHPCLALADEDPRQRSYWYISGVAGPVATALDALDLAPPTGMVVSASRMRTPLGVSGNRCA